MTLEQLKVLAIAHAQKPAQPHSCAKCGDTPTMSHLIEQLITQNND